MVFSRASRFCSKGQMIEHGLCPDAPCVDACRVLLAMASRLKTVSQCVCHTAQSETTTKQRMCLCINVALMEKALPVLSLLWPEHSDAIRTLEPIVDVRSAETALRAFAPVCQAERKERLGSSWTYIAWCVLFSAKEALFWFWRRKLAEAEPNWPGFHPTAQAVFRDKVRETVENAMNVIGNPVAEFNDTAILALMDRVREVQDV